MKLIVAPSREMALAYCREHDIRPYAYNTRIITERGAFKAVRGCVLGKDDTVIIIGKPEEFDDIKELVYSLIPTGVREIIVDVSWLATLISPLA